MPDLADSPQLQQLQADVLQRMFGEEAYHYNLTEGTVKTTGDMRMIYLSSDIVKGIHQALTYEAGEAWRIILHSCGYLWGKNVVKHLRKDLKLMGQQDLDKLPVTDYLYLLEQFFATHGWGQVKIHLDDAQQYGIVRVSLKYSLFVEVLNHAEERVDGMIEGILHGFFEQISGDTNLGCVEASCVRLGAPQCEFLISGAARLERIESSIESGADFNAVLAELRAA
jgi:predicted hydrocarbon binding protein